jgi:hypothetical protein
MIQTIEFSGTTVAVFQIIHELHGIGLLSKEFVASVAPAILDTHHGCALAPDPGGQNASHNAFFSRGIQHNLPAVRTRRSSHFAILQSRKAQAQSSKVLHCAR